MGKGGAGSPGGADDSSLKQTHWSTSSSPGLESSSGPKMLSRSAMESFRDPSSSLDTSEVGCDQDAA